MYPPKGSQIKSTFKTGHNTTSNSSLNFHNHFLFLLSFLPPSIPSFFPPSFVNFFLPFLLPSFLSCFFPSFFSPSSTSLPSSVCLPFFPFLLRNVAKSQQYRNVGRTLIFREKRTCGCGPGTVMRYTCLLTAFRVAGASACSQVCVWRTRWECPSCHLQHPMGLLLQLEKLFGSSGAWCSTTPCLSRILKGPPARSWCPCGPSSPSSSWPATQPTWLPSWSRRSLWTKWLASVTKR